MDRFLVPRLGFALVIGLATLLIGVIVLRSPDTHANLWNGVRPGYARTPVTMVGGEVVWEIPWAQIALLLDEEVGLRGGASPMDPDRQVYLGAGCATCHGLDARGGPVGPPLAGSVPEIVERMVRDGPGGMPAYSEVQLSDADLEKLAAYLQRLETTEPSAEELAALQRLSYDPSVPLDVLLKGKAALRKSCHACHAPPTKAEILGAFATDAEVTSLVAQMVRETTLGLEDAEVIAYYMLAIRNGADPVKAP
ncbi:MAG: c-type cytochrome [Anaerolineae bacterium]